MIVCVGVWRLSHSIFSRKRSANILRHVITRHESGSDMRADTICCLCRFLRHYRLCARFQPSRLLRCVPDPPVGSVSNRRDFELRTSSLINFLVGLSAPCFSRSAPPCDAMIFSFTQESGGILNRRFTTAIEPPIFSRSFSLVVHGFSFPFASHSSRSVPSSLYTHRSLSRFENTDSTSPRLNAVREAV